MPIDVSFLHPVLQVYQDLEKKRQFNESSAAQKQQFIENQKLEREKLQQEHDDRIAQIEANKTIHEASNKISQANLDMVKAQALQQFQDYAAKTGNTPAGFKMDKMPEVSVSPFTTNQQGQQEFNPAVGTTETKGNFGYSNPLLGSFEAPDPTKFATQQADLSRISLAPKTEAEVTKKTAENAAEAQKTILINQAKSVLDKELQAQKDAEAAKRTKDTNESRYRTAIEAANIKARATKGAADPGDKLLDPDTAARFGVAFGTKQKEVFGKTPGVKLTTTQTQKLASLESFEKAAIQLEQKLKTYGYDKYFAGFGGGNLKEIVRGAQSNRDTKQEEIRQAIGDLESLVVKERAGTAFSKNEQELLEQSVLTPKFTESPDTAKTKLEGMIGRIRALRGDLIESVTNRTLGGTGNTPGGGPKVPVYNPKTDKFE